ncbi:hypothetical protein BOX15_Mlig001812g1 [Macrostomum lignano]|uniref:Ion_trans domain-containing protein n=1 Tax=Macrostomum lignano TaxID=282301 RepID=A0A267F2B7_9PLAT|nr:hypothetical protein BOX15_Mlig001812g1 [Macrostomum lignano]
MANFWHASSRSTVQQTEEIRSKNAKGAAKRRNRTESSDCAVMIGHYRESRDRAWYPVGLTQFPCTGYSPDGDDPSLNRCRCGLSLEFHCSAPPAVDGSSAAANLAPPPLLPDGDAGEFEFPGIKRHAKFVRLNAAESDTAIQQTLDGHWQLGRPTLIVNVHGGELEKKRQLKMIFKKGLWKAAESAGRDKSNSQGCWIVTDGLSSGIVKLTGDAVRDYTDAYGPNHMLAIGVVSEARAAARSNGGVVGSKPQLTGDELDANHTHFILVSGRHSDATSWSEAVEAEADFRARFSRAAASSSWTQKAGEESRVPMCGLLIGGDRTALRQVYQALVANRCPIVALKGTSGAADALVSALECHPRGDCGPTDKKDAAELDESKEAAFLAKLATVCQECFGGDCDRVDADMLHCIVRDCSGLIEVFDMEEDFDLDGKMIASLLSSAGSDSHEHKLNLKQLKISLALNRADIAREKIFLENKKWKKGDLHDCMYQALMEDRQGFVSLFLEQGFSLDDFLTIHMLERLYSDQLKRMNSKAAIFHQLWEYHHKSHRRGRQVQLRQVGKVIKVLVGDFYQPLYTKKDFEKNYTKSTATADSLAEERTEAATGRKVNSVGASGILPTPQRAGRRQAAQPRETELLQVCEGRADADNRKELSKLRQNSRIGRAEAGESEASVAMNRWLSAGRELQPRRVLSDLASLVTAACCQADDAHSKSLVLVRPARELMIWALLVGKLQMAELFWSMEKEPIAGALLASILLKAMERRTDDFTDKEEFQRGAAQYEDRAWGVLDQCYREDERRAQFLINRELDYYGDSSCIYLAAEGESIKFMAHPCCQDFLTGAWLGQLSQKNALTRFLLGTVCGLICPPLVARVMLYKLDEEAGVDCGDVGCSVLRETASTSRRSSQDRSATLANAEQLSARGVINRMQNFYMAPVIRFIYNSISYLTFLFIFSYLLLYNLTHSIGPLECVIIVWMLTLLLEEVKQATLSGISFSTYISDSWNKLDCLAVGLFFLGLALRIVSLLSPAPRIAGYSAVLTDDTFAAARVCYAFSLFAYYVRLVYIFSFHIALGPKLIMIGKMVSNDLVPFMVILLVFVLGYGVAAQSIAYPTGLFTPDAEFNGTRPERMSRSAVFASFLSRAYFQMFGNFALDAAQAADPGCKEEGRCPHWTGRWLAPLMLAVYVLLTNILMFNLLIAMFSSTYESINQFSALYWNYQRYSMIKEYTERSPLAPPLMAIWQAYQLLRASGGCGGGDPPADPLKVRRPVGGRGGDRELVKWEHMKAADFLRAEQLSQLRRHGGGGAGVGAGLGDVYRREIVRAAPTSSSTTPVSPSAGSEAADAVRRTLAEAASGLGADVERRFHAVDGQLLRLAERVQDRTAGLAEAVARVSAGLAALQEAQLAMARSLEPRRDAGPAATAAAASVADLVASAASAAAAEATARPPAWFREVAIRAAADAIRSAAPPPPIRPPQPPPTSPPAAPLKPRVSNPSVGRLVQHRCRGHRLWRFAPFNFERYPGMRMNVPPERTDWQVDYPEYFAFDVSDEVVVFPTVEACDTDKNLRCLQFNTYDVGQSVGRRSLLGPYELDSASGAPLNPAGRTGLRHRGLLPRWGPNHALVLALTRWQRNPPGEGAVVRRLGRPILQAAALLRHKQYCLPWFLTDHQPGCDYVKCSVDVARSFVINRLQQQQQQSLSGTKQLGLKSELQALQKAEVKQTFTGYLDDHLNADNAWIEAVVVNIHESDKFRFSDDMLLALAESDCEEQARWLEVAQTTALRSSHCDLLKTVASERQAYF